MVSDFYKGVHYALLGFKDMFRPGVKRYVFLPLLINVAVFGGIFYVGADYIVEFKFLQTLPKWLQWASWLFSVIKALLIAVAIMVLFAACAIVATFVANFIGAPFNGLLSDAFASTYSARLPTRTLINTLSETLLRETRKYLYYIPRAIGFGVVALILFFIPGLNIALPILFYWFTALMMSIEYIDYPADSLHISFDELLIKRKERRWLHMGFGLTVALLSSIPILNFFVMPASVVGATRLWHENYRQN